MNAANDVSLAEYLDSVKERLLIDAAVSSFQIVRERATLTDGHLRARLTLTDGSLIEFSEYVQRSPTFQEEKESSWKGIRHLQLPLDGRPRRFNPALGQHAALSRPARFSAPHSRRAY